MDRWARPVDGGSAEVDGMGSVDPARSSEGGRALDTNGLLRVVNKDEAKGRLRASREDAASASWKSTDNE